MDVDAYIETIERNAPALADSAERVGLDAPAPTCPEWQVRDIVGHLGGVHRWAASIVRDAIKDPGEAGDLAKPPADGDLLAWFHDGFTELIDVLRAAPDSLECWTFLPAPTPRAFWARRQAHETAIHRVDVECAGGTLPAYDAAFAVDGLDELLLGFLSRRRGRLLTDRPVAVGVKPDDAAPHAAWTMTIGPHGREVTRGDAQGDCVLTGHAADLYLLLWNRRDVEGIQVEGDASVLDLWREKAQVTWS